jgi:hypothetical protein
MNLSPKIKELIANRIILRSPKGKTCAWFDASSEGAVSLSLYGPKASLTLCIDSDGNPKINLQNKRNRVAVAIGVSDDIGPGITLHDPEGRPVCFITVPKDGIPRIELFRVVSTTKGDRIWSTPAPETKSRKNAEPSTAPNRRQARQRRVRTPRRGGGR